MTRSVVNVWYVSQRTLGVFLLHKSYFLGHFKVFSRTRDIVSFISSVEDRHDSAPLSVPPSVMHNTDDMRPRFSALSSLQTTTAWNTASSTDLAVRDFYISPWPYRSLRIFSSRMTSPQLGDKCGRPFDSPSWEDYCDDCASILLAMEKSTIICSRIHPSNCFPLMQYQVFGPCQHSKGNVQKKPEIWPHLERLDRFRRHIIQPPRTWGVDIDELPFHSEEGWSFCSEMFHRAQ
ncbi:uncharacterized protein EV420DRAFT_864644 [Desarmillaria tabescens]|uniref:Uncharacterized protein n=1 Tax=Armillaria tabescens TaxID=1929756 RepID=A0AA39JS34_ARMTA|nr:uncharacterized protein EV420DRAFT_864644 [Desarmillaria tabescens]KAK0447891.1 hypothetical protein EV420DRAFT_864644 [Desarmillaria tabescens]